MHSCSYNIIVAIILPSLISIPGAPWPVLPAGQHVADLSAVAENFATNPRRKSLFAGLLEASGDLRRADCLKLYVDGSYVTGKPCPGDYDACWDPADVDPELLDPVFLNFANQRAAQKMKYGGEFFPAFFPANKEGHTFLDFFQIERFSGAKKGIVLVELATDPMLQSHR